MLIFLTVNVMAHGKWIFFHENGKVSMGTIAKETILNNVPIAKNAEVCFYQNGGFEQGTLVRDSVVDGKYHCKGGNIIRFNKNGFLESCTSPAAEVLNVKVGKNNDYCLRYGKIEKDCKIVLR